MKANDCSKRRFSTPVHIGSLTLSSSKPIAVQSMLNTSTMDTVACVEQAIRIIETGGELVRITAQGVREAENLKNIREELNRRGYTTPLSADIHFNSDAALVAAKYVEKVRINPGNFVDKRATFKELHYTDEEYAQELARLKERFISFLDVCNTYQTAVRIGTNHGSLSDRILSRYGNTPEGMVEATMEYLRVAKEVGFHNVVISLKSSDSVVMVSAVRMLVAAMDKEDMHFPLHLGVTEAGEGEDGRIRSAIGIGTLLNEGIGDTIRVSLTEAPEKEIPVAKAIIAASEGDVANGVCSSCRKFLRPLIVGDLSGTTDWTDEVRKKLGLLEHEGELIPTLRSPEVVYFSRMPKGMPRLSEKLAVMVPEAMASEVTCSANIIRLIDGEHLNPSIDSKRVAVRIASPEAIHLDVLKKLKAEDQNYLVLDLVPGYSSIKAYLKALETIDLPILLRISGVDDPIGLSVKIGGLFLDRLLAGLWINDETISTGLHLSQNILQSCGSRRFKTEFVSCPGCGRTLYDLQGSVARVKKAFGHLSKLKIAVMGCIVNGPGEMNDADYGYVGAGNGKVNLYKGHHLVNIGVAEAEAIDALRDLIKAGGDWQED